MSLMLGYAIPVVFSGTLGSNKALMTEYLKHLLQFEATLLVDILDKT